MIIDQIFSLLVLFAIDFVTKQDTWIEILDLGSTNRLFAIEFCLISKTPSFFFKKKQFIEKSLFVEIISL